MKAETTTENACAKINLYLDIVGRREDGYHLIDGIMQTVSLCDRLTVGYEEADGSEVTLTCAGNPEVPAGGENLAVRAANLFLTETGKTGRVTILLEKRIPMAAGLAGGSADAAAVLRALNRLTGVRMNEEALSDLGKKLGADVPFCVRGGAMRTRGIGEILSPASGLRDCRLVIACGGEGISTPWGYAKLDEIHHGFREPHPVPATVEKLTDLLRKDGGRYAFSAFFNIFEALVEKERPAVAEARKTLLKHGAEAAMMSGSGPSVFGVFRSEKEAEEAKSELVRRGFFAEVCEPVEKDFFKC